jgi:hypothetical protein
MLSASHIPLQSPFSLHRSLAYISLRIPWALKSQRARVAGVSLVSFSPIRTFFASQTSRFSSVTVVHAMFLSFTLAVHSSFILLILLILTSPEKSLYKEAHVLFCKLCEEFFNRLTRFMHSLGGALSSYNLMVVDYEMFSRVSRSQLIFRLFSGEMVMH